MQRHVDFTWQYSAVRLCSLEQGRETTIKLFSIAPVISMRLHTACVQLRTIAPTDENKTEKPFYQEDDKI